MDGSFRILKNFQLLAILIILSSESSAWCAIQFPLRGDSNELILGFGTLEAVAYSPTDEIVATAGSLGVMVWNAETGELLQWYQKHFNVSGREKIYKTVRSVTFSPNGQWILSSGDDNTQRLWDWKTGNDYWVLDDSNNISLSLRHYQYTRLVDYTPDSKYLLITGFNFLIFHLLDLQNKSEIQVIIPSWNRLASAFAFAPTGHQVALAHGNVIDIWDSDQQKEIQQLNLPKDKTHGGIFTMVLPSNRERIIIGSGKFIQLWDCQSITLIKEYPIRSAYLLDITLSPDRKQVLSNDDALATLWDADTGETIKTFSQDVPNPNSFQHIEQVVYAHDGKKILIVNAVYSKEDSGSFPVRDSYMTIWDLTSGNKIYNWNTNGDGVFFAAFLPSGNKVLTGDSDGTARIWKLSDLPKLTPTVAPPLPTPTLIRNSLPPTPTPTATPTPHSTPTALMRTLHD
jgi:WD40 repeat protein